MEAPVQGQPQSTGGVRLGVKVSGQASTVSQLRTCWRIVDESTFDHLWNFDHLAGVKTSGLASPIFDGWTLLAAAAEATKRVRIGCLVTGNTYRHPALLAKLAVTVDHLSGGRLEFGLGAAWAESEHRMFHLEGLDHRIGRLSESLTVLKSLWTEERTNFDGRYFKLSDAIANPKPVQRPHPPIWIGGRGQATLRLAARHADVWNVSGEGADSAGALGRTLDAACEAIGRQPRSVRWSAQVFWDGVDRGKMQDEVAAYVEQGFTELVIFPDVRAGGVDLIRAVEASAEVAVDLTPLATPARRRR